jgi:hypothetical protein
MASTPWFLGTDKETGIPIVTIVDDMTIEEFGEFLTAISDAPSHRDSERCIWDLRGVSGLISTMAIRYLGASARQARCAQRTAIVVERDVHFGLARMFAIGMDQPGTTRRVFRDYGQAQSWLMRTAPSRGPVSAPYRGNCQRAY